VCMYFRLMTFHGYQTKREGERSAAGQSQYVNRLITKHSIEMKFLYSGRNVYGVHLNKALARGDSVFYSYWLTGRESALRAVHTMPLLIATAVQQHNVDVELFGPLWSVLLTRLAACGRFVYMSSISIQNEIADCRTVFALSNAGFVGSNRSQDMDVCVFLFCVCVVLCLGSGLATGWYPVQRVLPTVYRIFFFIKY
jgi:hypothetical protein